MVPVKLSMMVVVLYVMKKVIRKLTVLKEEEVEAWVAATVVEGGDHVLHDHEVHLYAKVLADQGVELTHVPKNSK